MITGIERQEDVRLCYVPLCCSLYEVAGRRTHSEEPLWKSGSDKTDNKKILSSNKG